MVTIIVTSFRFCEYNYIDNFLNYIALFFSVKQSVHILLDDKYNKKVIYYPEVNHIIPIGYDLSRQGRV